MFVRSAAESRASCSFPIPRRTSGRGNTASTPERGGDVAGSCLALSHGVLGGGGRDLAGSCEVRDGGAVAKGEHVGAARNREVLVHDEASSVERQAQGGDQGARRDPRAPHQRMGRHERPVREREVSLGGVLYASTVTDLDPAFAKYLQGDLAQVLAELGQDPGCAVHQEPTHLLGAYRWIVTDGLPREELRLGGEFRPGVSCAYHDEG